MPMNNVTASPNLEIGLGFILRFIGFLGASRILLNSINRLVNTELDTRDLGERNWRLLLGAVFGFFFSLSF